MESRRYDVVVVGAGNAAVGAAMAASEAGASVLVLEKAPKAERGGNSRYTHDFSYAYRDMAGFRTLFPGLLTDDEAAGIDVGRYTVEDLYGDLMSTSQNRADAELCRLMAEESYPLVEWLTGHGVRWQMLWRHAFNQPDGRRMFNPRIGRPAGPIGGIKAVLDRFFDLFEQRPGMEVRYETRAVKLLMDEGGHGVRGVRVEDPSGFHDIPVAGGVILACGGFEANPEMRARYLGQNWDLVKVRGTRYNTGEGLQMGLDIGAAIGGHISAAHANPVFFRGPDTDMEDAAFAHSYYLGILVNLSGKRFVDEATDYRRSSYAMVGREVLAQPKGLAFSIFDSKVVPFLDRRYYATEPRLRFGERADSLEELATKLGLDGKELLTTVQRFNAAVQEDVAFDPGTLDGKAAVGIEPRKSNWALTIDTPPFLGYPVACGITFTYGGLKVDRHANVVNTEGKPIPGLFATGEIAGTYYHNYLGGSGLLKGMVLGRLAGRYAAERAVESKAIS